MRYLKKSAAISLMLLVLSACGQRGPLFLPEEAPQENQPSSSIETQGGK